MVLGALGSLDSANAVHVNPVGLGQVLIYPYYTTRAGVGGGRFNTYLSVVNTTPATKAIKVTFLEGKNGGDVLSFNAYLSPLDTWTAAVVPVGNGAGSQLITSDNSCMVPSTRSLPFSNASYAGANVDGETDGLDRTNEGYFEILELGEMTGTITTGLKHNPAGAPANCAVLGGTLAALTEANVVTDKNVVAGHGGLTGTATLINPTTGAAFGYEPTALDDWNERFPTWTPAGSSTPDLSFAFPPVSKVFDGNRTVMTNWFYSPNAYDAVSAVLMHDNLINEFMMDAPTQSRTEWVVTFPTKRGYVGNDPLTSSGARQNTAAMRPFQSNFWTGGSCDYFTGEPHDREEFTTNYLTAPPELPFELGKGLLCWAANVITYRAPTVGASNILGSVNLFYSLDSYTTPYSQSMPVPTAAQQGWKPLNFTLVTTVPTAHFMRAPVGATMLFTSINGGTTWLPVDATYYGLPVVGFGLQTYTNSAAGGSMYGGRFNHKYTRLIKP